jgi:hypothetical protein
MRMVAKFVLFHDDDCGERLVGGFCHKCGFPPDMQSLSGAYFCPSCNIELKGMVCSMCGCVYEKP